MLNRGMLIKRKVVTGNPSDIELTAKITAAGQTVTVNKYFDNVQNIDRGDGSGVVSHTANTTHIYSDPGTYKITLSLPEGVSMWEFVMQQMYTPLVPQTGTTADNIYVSRFPTLNDYFLNNGGFYFMSFNNNGALTSLPRGSFDTSTIADGAFFFANFNSGGLLTSLPEGSFDISQVTHPAYSFFADFNNGGALTSLPEGSFDTSNIIAVNHYVFSGFNTSGAIISLPKGSFNFSNMTSDTLVYFCANFNYHGALSSLPAGSFDMSNTHAEQGNGMGCFEGFNTNGALKRNNLFGIEIKNTTENTINFSYKDGGSNYSTSVAPGDSFQYYEMDRDTRADIQLTAVTTAAGQTVKINKYFANDYTVDRGDGSAVQNLTAATTHTYSTAGGYIITLSLAGTAKRWTFSSSSSTLVPKTGTTAGNVYVSVMPSLADYFGDSASAPGDYFFRRFNYNGALTSLPAGSFDTSNITTVGSYFFNSFNAYGALTSLPAGSFDTSNITTVGNNFFSSFNDNGALTSLPAGSFDTSNITTVGISFFNSFNYNGALTSLPAGSFDTSNITTVRSYFFNSFNNYGALTRNTTSGIEIYNPTSVNQIFYHRTGTSTNSSISVPAGSSFQYYTAST